MSSTIDSDENWRNVDIDSSEFNEHFDQTIHELVRECPVARSEVGEGYWLVNRYRDVRKCGQDWRTFSNEGGFLPNRPPGMIKLLPEESDPPYHTAWRRALNPYFTTEAVSEHIEDIRRYAHEFIDNFEERGECDFVREFAYPLPGKVILMNLLGVPIEDLPYLQEAVDSSVHASAAGAAAARQRTHQYLEEHLQRRSAEPPRGDVIDAILRGVELEDGPAPWADKVSVLADVLTGGLGTTAYAMSGAIYHLARHPNDLARLQSEPDRLPVALEELLRFYSPVVALARTATRDTEVASTQIRSGEVVMINYTSANRDPDVFEDPDEIRIDREPNRHISFGVGPHRCIGANLARLELQVAIGTFIERIPTFRLKPGTQPVYATSIARTMREMRLVFP